MEKRTKIIGALGATAVVGLLVYYADPAPNKAEFAKLHASQTAAVAKILDAAECIKQMPSEYGGHLANFAKLRAANGSAILAETDLPDNTSADSFPVDGYHVKLNSGKASLNGKTKLSATIKNFSQDVSLEKEIPFCKE